jgi:uncharacterized protein (TIGR02996 family)
MDTGAALLAAVRARPDDDTPRLAYADWLDDVAGDLPDPDAARARAAFIRLQCELSAPPPPEPWPSLAAQLLPIVGFHRRADEHRAALAAHAERLAEREAKEDEARDLAGRFGHPTGPWTLEFLAAAGGQSAGWNCGCWTRGFIKELRLSAADWLAHADAILAAQPVRGVVLTTAPALRVNRAEGTGRNSRGWWELAHPRATACLAIGDDGWTGLLTRLLAGVWPDISFKFIESDLDLGLNLLQATPEVIRGQLIGDIFRSVPPPPF